MNLFTGGDIGRLNRLIFSPDPVLRFRHENLHEAVMFSLSAFTGFTTFFGFRLGG
jgi:hypothetical protein